jgi:hypothetical protein
MQAGKILGFHDIRSTGPPEYTHIYLYTYLYIIYIHASYIVRALGGGGGGGRRSLSFIDPSVWSQESGWMDGWMDRWMDGEG